MRTISLRYLRQNITFIFILATVAMMTGSCGTSSVYITVTRPAEINIKGYEKIAIGDILDVDGKRTSTSNTLAGAITGTLSASGRFQILDRMNLARIMDEQSLVELGIIDETTAAEIGKIIGTAALVFGNIQTNDYQENVSIGKKFTSKNGKEHQYHTRTGTYRVTVNLQVVDVETSRVLAARTLSAVKTERKTADMKEPGTINAGALYDRCINDISKKFIRLIAPYEVNIRAAFMTDELLPETDRAVAMFRIGEWDDGMVNLRAAVGKSGLPVEVQAKAYYNLGLAETYSGAFDDALDHLKTALSLAPKSRRIQQAIIRTKLEQESAEKLAEQL